MGLGWKDKLKETKHRNGIASDGDEHEHDVVRMRTN